MKNITIFGGSLPRPGDPAYEEAQRLGRLLAQSGYTVITGGYIGTMEAASRGASEAGGHVIGVTCDEIEAYRPGKPNPWVKEELRVPSLRDRIYTLMVTGEAALALPGGLGTLAEISSMWNHMLIHAVAPRPLILIGASWEQTMQIFINNFYSYIPSGQQNLLQYAPDIETAVEILNGSK